MTLHLGCHLLAGPNGHWQIPKSWGLGGQCDVLRVGIITRHTQDQRTGYCTTVVPPSSLGRSYYSYSFKHRSAATGAARRGGELINKVFDHQPIGVDLPFSRHRNSDATLEGMWFADAGPDCILPLLIKIKA